MREESLRKGPWYEEEDERLKAFVAILGGRRWDSLAKAAGLRRSGKSCRLRWLNYLRPCLKQSPISLEEEHFILQLQKKWGNKWAKIARRLPGRTDNEIKNYWRTHLRKKIQKKNVFDYFSLAASNTLTTSSSSVETQLSNHDSLSQEENTTIIQEISRKGNDKISMDTELRSINGPYIDNQTELSDYTIASSPYQHRLLDWVTKLSREQKDGLSPTFWETDCSELRLNDYPITWNLGDNCSLDWADTLWDMDLFSTANSSKA